MKHRTASLCLLLTSSALGALGISGCADAGFEDLLEAARKQKPPRPAPIDPECPDVCAAICIGEPEPEVPRGCPIPDCGCQPPPNECPDECAVSCGRLAPERVPQGCEQSVCDCEPPECPDICAAVCSGQPEPTVPPGCPIPDCQCD
jgi:hypothetical protein